MKLASLLLGLVVATALAFDSPALPLTNSVALTTNLTFHLETLDETAGAKSVVKSHQKLACQLLGTSTNYIWYRVIPPERGRFDFHLYDENGKEVPKSKAGMAMTATPSRPTLKELQTKKFGGGGGINSTSGAAIPFLRPDDAFIIPAKGTYELTVRMSLCVIVTNGQPDLSAMVGASPRNINLRGVRSSNDLDILTSPPLRIQVIKEK